MVQSESFSDLQCIYDSLFGEGRDPAIAGRLRASLRALDANDVAGTRAPVDAVLTDLNRPPGAPGRDPRLSVEQLLLLRRAFASDELAAIAPREPSPADPATAARLLAFWRRLLSDIGAARALQERAGAYHRKREATARGALIDTLRSLDAGEPWNDEQIEAVVTLLVAEPRFAAISPWPMPANVW